MFSCEICEIFKKTYFEEHLKCGIRVFHNFLFFFNFTYLNSEDSFTFYSVSRKLLRRKIAPPLKLEFGLRLGLELGAIFLGSNCPRTEINCKNIQAVSRLLNVFWYRFFVFYLLWRHHTPAIEKEVQASSLLAKFLKAH